ncbi:MAG: HEPN domain-containing protein [Planctomycetota bacterium]|jgi:HEPN domain-containing protein
MDIQKQISYWLGGAEEDIAAADSLLEKKHPRHALFFAHLAVEKILKAHVVKVTDDVPPHIHDLLRLAEIAELSVPGERREFLAYLQRYCLEGRYPGSWPAAPSPEEGQSGVREAREVLKWLGNLLK